MFITTSCRVGVRFIAAIALVVSTLGLFIKAPLAQRSAVDQAAAAALGKRVFNDDRFSHPDGDLRTSCASCHKTADPPGARAFTEQLAHSWHPWRNPDPGRDTLRNTPTLLDVSAMPILHMDGEFSSLEEQSHETLVGRNLGWLPEERPRALAHLKAIVLEVRDEESYRKALKQVYGVDAAEIEDEERVAWMAKALAAFMKTLDSERDTPYDAFIKANNFDPEPAEGETALAYSARLIATIELRAAGGSLKTTADFADDAVEGAKIFFRTKGDAQVGNCVACHAPPLFTDFAFHNTGVSQENYDTVHGDGAFAALNLPAFDTIQRPSKQWASIVKRKNPEHADLGRWNFASPGDEAYRGRGESAEDYMARTVATFKTPTLRQLGLTDPYMHNGGYATVEQTIAQKRRASDWARAGQLRNGDPEMAAIRLTGEDAPILAAFLRTLTKLGVRNVYPSNLQPKGDRYTGPRYGVQYPKEVTPTNVRRRYNEPD